MITAYNGKPCTPSDDLINDVQAGTVGTRPVTLTVRTAAEPDQSRVNGDASASPK